MSPEVFFQIFVWVKFLKFVLTTWCQSAGNTAKTWKKFSEMSPNQMSFFLYFNTLLHHFQSFRQLWCYSKWGVIKCLLGRNLFLNKHQTVKTENYCVCICRMEEVLQKLCVWCTHVQASGIVERGKTLK